MEYTTDYRLASWLSEGNDEAVSAYILGRYDMHVPSATIASWKSEWLRTWYGERSPFPFLSEPDMWLKKRIGFEAGPGREDFGRLEVELHVFPIHWEPVELPDNEPASNPHWARTQLISLVDADPVNRTARRLIHDDSQPCPWCRQWFRNPWALAYHAEDRHGQKIEKRIA